MKPALLLPTVVVISLIAGAAGARFFGPDSNAAEPMGEAAEPTQTNPASAEKLDLIMERLTAIEAKQDQWQSSPRQLVAMEGGSEQEPAGGKGGIDPTAQAVPAALVTGQVGSEPEDWFTALTSGNLNQMERQELWDKALADGRVDELIDLFKARAEADPNNPDAHNELGDAYIQKVQSMGSSFKTGLVATKADKAYLKALDLDPNHLGARRSRAISLSFWPPMLGKQAEAIQEFEVLVEKQNLVPVEPNHVHAYLLLGNMHMQMGKITEARTVWQNGLARFPGNADLMRQLELTRDR